MTKGLLFISAIFLTSLAFDAVDVMDNDHLATELTAQILVSTALIDIVRKLSVEHIILAK